MHFLNSILRGGLLANYCDPIPPSPAPAPPKPAPSPPALGSAGNSTECADRQIRLWLHIDLTGSFTQWRQNSPPELKKSLSTLLAKFPNMKFGASGFGDRIANIPPGYPNPGQAPDMCYVEGVDFEDPFDDDKFTKLRGMTSKTKNSYADLEEDPLDAIAWIAKEKFGDYKDDELRIITMLTDYGPHYGPKYPSGTEEPDHRAEDFVTCNSLKRYFTLNEIFDPLKTRRIFPLATVYPGIDCINKWTTVFNELGYDVNKHLIDMGQTYSLQKFTDAITDVIEQNKCEPAPTNAPSEGTVPTDPPQDSTQVSTSPVPDSTTVTATGGTTNKPGLTTTGAESHSGNTPIIVGASAGAAALLAAAAGYTMTRSNNPSLDVDEAEMGVDDNDGPDREAAITMNEDAYE